MQVNIKLAQDILNKSQILYTAEELSQRTKAIAEAIEAEIENEIPLLLTVMNGGMFFASEVMKHIKKPFIADYIHASRYGDTTFGSGHISWYRQPKAEDVKDKVIYVLDDILDEGHTLAEIVRVLTHLGAKQCKLAVLIDKNLGKAKPINAHFIGYTAPNKYLFGCGMDIYGIYRQLSNIYIYNE
ncbi:MAG: hypoxanthine-guanine phosphoribosyltransferase [Burkholderiales bacterium]|jgi:hypoxanthine phosphoribosyltransferase|nr:hypoxanthine-guanine phosphoribosyltransferase [Burkholderiales bacterium]